MDKLLYRPRDAAAVLGISKTVLYGLIRANKIRSIKDGKFRFITADALHQVRPRTRTAIRGSKLNATEPATSRRRRINGDGSVYKRQDGYWVGAFYAHTTSGARKRVVVYGKTLDEARTKLGKAQERARAGIPVPDESWKLGPYLHYLARAGRQVQPAARHLCALRDQHPPLPIRVWAHGS